MAFIVRISDIDGDAAESGSCIAQETPGSSRDYLRMRSDALESLRLGRYGELLSQLDSFFHTRGFGEGAAGLLDMADIKLRDLIAESYLKANVALFVREDDESSLARIGKFSVMLKRSPDDRLRALGYHGTAIVDYYIGHYDDAIANCNAALLLLGEELCKGVRSRAWESVNNTIGLCQMLDEPGTEGLILSAETFDHIRTHRGDFMSAVVGTNAAFAMRGLARDGDKSDTPGLTHRERETLTSRSEDLLLKAYDRAYSDMVSAEDLEVMRSVHKVVFGVLGPKVKAEGAATAVGTQVMVDGRMTEYAAYSDDA
jgi:hypothetical protein